MKITTFNPQIITNDAETVEKLFEELGFEKKHNPKGVGEYDVNAIRMKDANGFHLDISQPEMQLPRDLVVIRMNVDNFEEAYEFLLSKGFTNLKGEHTVDTRTNKSCMMISPSGFAFDLCQHIKDHD